MKLPPLSDLGSPTFMCSSVKQFGTKRSDSKAENSISGVRRKVRESEKDAATKRPLPWKCGCAPPVYVNTHTQTQRHRDADTHTHTSCRWALCG